MKDNKRSIIALTLALVMVFSLAACGSGSSDSGSDTDTGQDEPKHVRVQMGNRVQAPAETTYLTTNKLEITTIDTYADGTERPVDDISAWQYLNEITEEERQQYDFNNLAFQGNYVQISGLKDKEVEAAINEKIKNLYMDNLSRIPPYRGIKAMLGENPEPIREGYQFPSMYVNVAATFNNILSLSLAVNRAYKDVSGTNASGGDIVYVGYHETLNIDLNTGEEIPIEVIFCDNVDPFEYIDNAVRAELESGNYENEDTNMMYVDMRLTGQFHGISPEQKYYLTQGGAYLIFDYETPELSGDFSAQTVFVPYTSDFAITERFYDENVSIYESEEPGERLFLSSSYDDRIPLESYTNNIEEENIIFTKHILAAPDTPEVLKEKMLEMTEIDEPAVIAELNALIAAEETTGPAFDSIYMSCSSYTNSSRVGHYVNIMNEYYRYISAHHGSYGAYGEDDYRNFGWSDVVYSGGVYDISKGINEDSEPIELADLFTPGSDYEAIIKENMVKQLNEVLVYAAGEYEEVNGEGTYPYFLSGAKDELDQQFLDRVYDSITGFQLNEASISLWTAETDGIFEEVYGYKPYEAPAGYDVGRYTHNMKYIYYNDIGYDNLVIFK